MDDVTKGLDEAISILNYVRYFERDHDKLSAGAIKHLTEARDTLNRIIDGAKK